MATFVVHMRMQSVILDLDGSGNYAEILPQVKSIL